MKKQLLTLSAVLTLSALVYSQHIQQEDTIQKQEKTLLEYQEAFQSTTHEVETIRTELEKKNRELDGKNQEIESLKKKVKHLESIKNVDVTFYTSDCDTGCIGITKTGYNVQNTVKVEGYRVVAVDPSFIPLGTVMEMKIDGQVEKVIAADTGSDIQGNRMDVLVRHESTAFRLGYQENIPVKIVGFVNL